LGYLTARDEIAKAAADGSHCQGAMNPFLLSLEPAAWLSNPRTVP